MYIDQYKVGKMPKTQIKNSGLNWLHSQNMLHNSS